MTIADRIADEREEQSKADFPFLGLLRYARMTMGKIIRLWWKGRRLKGLDEFETPEFVGRMERVERRRKLAWGGALAGAVAIGAAIGLVFS